MSRNYYILKHKDHNVATLAIEDDGEIYNCRIIDKLRVPFRRTDDDRHLIRWWNERAVPEGRKQLSKLLAENGCNSPKELLLKNLGLSLTDSYWICPQEFDTLKFDDINLFDHGNKIIHFHDANGKAHYSTSPNAAIGGSLDKAAVYHNGEWFIEKQFNTRYPDGQQNVNEIFVSKVHERQGWREYTPYTVRFNKSGICENSISKYFTSKDKELISAYDLTANQFLFTTNSKYNGRIELDRYIGECVDGGLDEEYVRKSLDYMILMDYVTTNSDRHWSNFGVLRNPESLKLISVAPIFDHGNAMFFDSIGKMNRLGLVSLENTGIEDLEIARLRLVQDKTVVRADLLPTPVEVMDFYEEYGIREDRAKQIAESYGNKLDMFLEYQHGIEISFAREMDEYFMYGPPYIDQSPNRQYFDHHPEDITEEIQEELLSINKTHLISDEMADKWHDYFSLPKEERKGIYWDGKKYRIAVFEDIYLACCQEEGVSPEKEISRHFWKNCVEIQGYEPKYYSDEIEK